MTRADWLWLAVKVAGVMLVVAGVQAIPALGAHMLAVRETDESKAGPILEVLVPLAAGLFVLFADDRQWLPRVLGRTTPANGGDASPDGGERPRGLSREDVLWVGFKLLGAWLVAQGVLLLCQFSGFFTTGADAGWTLVGLALQLGWGVLLLFGDLPWRMACGGGARRTGAGPTPIVPQ